MRLLVISPPLVIRHFRNRWITMANEKNEFSYILALVPSRRPEGGFGQKFYIETRPEKIGNFELKCFEPTSEDNTRYRIKGFKAILKKSNPDIIFCVHHEGIVQLVQTILYRLIFFRKTKLIYFSMTAFPRRRPMKVTKVRHYVYNWYKFVNWQLIKFGTDGALCHYDRIENQMRADGYKKPILQQTQYGVDPIKFKACEEQGNELRRKLGLSGLVIGYCARFVEEKGILDLIEAFESIEEKCNLLLVGDGPLRDYVESWIKAKRYEHKVVVTGFVDHEEVERYFQAMDIFFLGSKETDTFIDTFPLVVAQAMACSLPVVGSRSGAIPYQLGNTGLLYDEGDIQCLVKHLKFLLNSREARREIGSRLKQIALDRFCIEAMNRKFVEFIKESII